PVGGCLRACTPPGWVRHRTTPNVVLCKPYSIFMMPALPSGSAAAGRRTLWCPAPPARSLRNPKG
ncbi:hypothetical protein, partial [Rothia dentocariosa]|uniref:hypothetical protein n=1 Tax=Rothia dentocariosa TaxID=2047 RepID=UPI001EE4B43D